MANRHWAKMMELCMQQTNAATETDNSKRTPALTQHLRTEATPKRITTRVCRQVLRKFLQLKQYSYQCQYDQL